MSFSINVSLAMKDAILHILSIRLVDKHDKYLGLPTLVGRSKKIVFTCVKDRVMKKLKSWKEKLLSKAGKEVLIKSVIQPIPTYIMSCFELPSSLCH